MAEERGMTQAGDTTNDAGMDGSWTFPPHAGQARLKALVVEWRQLASKARPVRERLNADERRWLDICADQLEAVIEEIEKCQQ
jgi:hypothetical protein